ncbi:hypothetical protein SRHO_G00000250 [Serrasalmus rhombeus]
MTVCCRVVTFPVKVVLVNQSVKQQCWGLTWGDVATQIRHFHTLVCFGGDKPAVRLSTRLSARVLSGARRAACSGSVEEPTPRPFHVSQCFMLSERDRSAIFGHFVGRRVKILTDRSVARSKTDVV